MSVGDCVNNRASIPEIDRAVSNTCQCLPGRNERDGIDELRCAKLAEKTILALALSLCIPELGVLITDGDELQPGAVRVELDGAEIRHVRVALELESRRVGSPVVGSKCVSVVAAVRHECLAVSAEGEAPHLSNVPELVLWVWNTSQDFLTVRVPHVDERIPPNLSRSSDASSWSQVWTVVGNICLLNAAVGAFHIVHEHRQTNNIVRVTTEERLFVVEKIENDCGRCCEIHNRALAEPMHVVLAINSTVSVNPLQVELRVWQRVAQHVLMTLVHLQFAFLSWLIHNGAAWWVSLPRTSTLPWLNEIHSAGSFVAAGLRTSNPKAFRKPGQQRWGITTRRFTRPRLESGTVILSLDLRLPLTLHASFHRHVIEGGFEGGLMRPSLLFLLFHLSGNLAAAATHAGRNKGVSADLTACWTDEMPGGNSPWGLRGATSTSTSHGSTQRPTQGSSLGQRLGRRWTPK
mmetsp:Transcript_18926/g.44362  ORF Transcript_18926/g.44362 Transcript_18926/m.44362 type:complete len:463 (+) Transcript_18926:2096-3484(+)